MLREAVGDPALHGRQPVPLEQPQQTGRGVVVKTAEVPEVPGNLAITVPGTAVAPIVTVIADVALIAKVMIVAAVTLSGGVTGVAGGGRAVVRVVAGVHRPPPRLPAPGRSVCMLLFNTQSPGRGCPQARRHQRGPRGDCLV